MPAPARVLSHQLLRLEQRGLRLCFGVVPSLVRELEELRDFADDRVVVTH